MPFPILAMEVLNKLCIYKTSSVLLAYQCQVWNIKDRAVLRKLGLATVYFRQKHRIWGQRSCHIPRSRSNSLVIWEKYFLNSHSINFIIYKMEGYADDNDNTTTNNSYSSSVSNYKTQIRSYVWGSLQAVNWYANIIYY